MAGQLVKTICGLLTFVFGVVIVVVILRTLTLQQRTISGPECKALDTDFIRGDKQLLSRFQQAIRLQTVSRSTDDFNKEEILQLHQLIKDSYRTLHSSPLVTREVIANYSLLYTIRGSDPSLKPLMLTGHLDVVPITDEEWEAPPFGGEIKNGFLYGRGTIDDKHTVYGILEAMEFFLSRNHKPQRTIYLGFGHDEEVGGYDGAYNIAQTLMDRGIQMEFLLDEGMLILEGGMPGITKPIALIGSTEKGRVTIKMSVTTKGGHSSMPRKESSIGILAQAVTRLEDNPHPSMFGTGPEIAMLEHIAGDMAVPFKVIMSNLWLFSPIVTRIMSQKPETNALVRTTTAVVQFNAGIKDNVIAPYAEVIVNHRIHPSQTVQEVIDYDRQIVNDDRVQFEVTDSMEPLPKSPYGDEQFGWQTIKTSILQVWGHTGAVVAPGIMIGNTDTRHYTKITKCLYRFSPTYFFPEDLPRFHGVNERISVKNYEQAVNFFYHVIVNAGKKELEPMHSHGEEL